MLGVLVAFSLLIWGTSSQTAVVIPSSLVGIEGDNLNVTCSLEGGPRPIFDLVVGGTPVANTGKLRGAVATPTGTRFVYGPLERAESGLEFVCDDAAGNLETANLTVYCKFFSASYKHRLRSGVRTSAEQSHDTSYLHSQSLRHTSSSPTNPPLCWKEKTSLTPLGLMLDQLPPTSPGPGMARSSPVMMLV